MSYQNSSPAASAWEPAVDDDSTWSLKARSVAARVGGDKGIADMMTDHYTSSSFIPNRPPATTAFKNWRRVVGGAVLLTSAVGVVFIWGFNNISSSNSQSFNLFTGVVEMEGSKHDRGKKIVSSHDHKKTTKPNCDDGYYSKRTLQTAYSLPFLALFKDTKGQKHFEASSVVIQGDYAYAVCDSSFAISKFATKLEPFAKSNVQVGDPHRRGVDTLDDDLQSGYEGLFFDDGSLYVVRESIQQQEKKGHPSHHVNGNKDLTIKHLKSKNLTTFHAVIEKLHLVEPQDYFVVESCKSEFEFEGASKGFEGVISVHDMNNELVVLGLCEGNYCSEDRKNERGNGHIVAMKRRIVKDEETGTTSCLWATIGIIKIPNSAYFLDYSDLTMDESGRIAITSQEDSQLWVGQMLGQDLATGLWNITEMKLDLHSGTIYDFPKNENCETVYCNIEGVHWLNHDTIMTVSDRMKSKGKQNFRCFGKDQSVHVFVLP